MTTTSASIGTAAYDELAGALRGDLIRPEDPGYDEARAVYNGMIDQAPGARSCRCRDVGRRRRPASPVRPRARGRRLAVARRRPQRGRARRSATVRAGHRPVACCSGVHGQTRGTARSAPTPGRVWGDVRPRDGRRFGMATPSGFLATTGVGGLHASAAGSATSTRRFGLHRATTSSRPTWCSPTARSSPPTQTRTPTCSGRCAAAAGTSASSPRSLFRCHYIGRARYDHGGPMLYAHRRARRR